MPSAIKTKKKQLNAKRDTFNCSMPSSGGKENRRNPAELEQPHFCHSNQVAEKAPEKPHYL